MAVITLGQVVPAQKGVWDSTSTYEHYDWVTYNGTAYLAVQDVPANYEPASQTYFWAIFGAKGDKGDKGDTGATGATGAQGVAGEDGADGELQPISNSVTSTSQTTCASSYAVKLAYDAATAASSSSSSAQTTANTALTTANAKAPIAHASTATTYGIGTSANYGHVKLSDSTSLTSGASAGIAATPTAVKSAYTLANTANTTATSALSKANEAISSGGIASSWVSDDKSNWYRKYSDGFIMQGGIYAPPATNYTLTLNTPFTTMTFLVLLSDEGNFISDTNGFMELSGMLNRSTWTTSTIKISQRLLDEANYLHWVAFGY